MDKERVSKVHDYRAELTPDRRDWRPVVDKMYRVEDESFFRECHKLGGDYEGCVADTMATLSSNAEFFRVKRGSYTFGFFVKTLFKSHAVLEGFHVEKGYRNAENLKEFWSIVKQEFSRPIYIGIYQGNTPALNHLKKNGFEELGTTEHQGKSFILLSNKLI